MNENRLNETTPASRRLAPLRWMHRAAGYCVRTVIGLVFLLIAAGACILAFPVYLIEELSKPRRRRHQKVTRPVVQQKTTVIQTREL